MAPKPEMHHSREAVEPEAEVQEQDRSLDSAREEEIRRRAYEIYVARGEEPGHDIEDWLQAERELTADRSAASGK